MKLALILILKVSLSFQSALAGPGVIMLAGGEAEGDIGVTTDWSYKPYKALIENGDVTGDKKIKVVVISLAQPDTNFMINYFKYLGANSAVNLVVATKSEAFEKKVNIIDNADVLFIRGGNQGLNYQLWKDTTLHNKIDALAKRGGAIGGTSSGSMIVTQYTMTGGRDFNSPDVMRNSHDVVLRDIKKRKSTGIHNDFLQLVPRLIVDTHCAQRARLGRLMAVQAKAIEDYQDKNIMGVCLEERTALVIKKNRAEVFGIGIAHFLQETANTKVIRELGTPLVYTDIRNDALTHGWIFDLEKRVPDFAHIPSSTVKISPSFNKRDDVSPFQVLSSPVRPLKIVTPPARKDLFIITDAYSELKLTNGVKKLSANHTNGFTLLYKHPEASVVYVDAGMALEGNDFGEISSNKTNAKLQAMETSSLILDCSTCSHKSLSPFVSNQDYKGKKLHSPGFINMRLHMIDARSNYNIQTRRTSLIDQDPRKRSIASKRK